MGNRRRNLANVGRKRRDDRELPRPPRQRASEKPKPSPRRDGSAGSGHAGRADLRDRARRRLRRRRHQAGDFVSAVIGYAPAKPLRLTPREVEVLMWTACGKTSVEIAGFMSVSDETTRAHIKNICFKLGAANKTHGTAIALVHGLIRAAPSAEWVIPLPTLFGLSEPAATRAPAQRSLARRDKKST
jgi:DNA-binding CsgD family transcriptional regulator